jgi:hypothetical protein
MGRKAPSQPTLNLGGRVDQSIGRSRVSRPLIKISISLVDKYKSINAAYRYIQNLDCIQPKAQDISIYTKSAEWDAKHHHSQH